MYTREEQVEIATQIIAQLGGFGKLKAMVGINNHCALDAGLKFSFKGSRKMNVCTIELNSMDTYDVKFYKVPKLNPYGDAKSLDRYFMRLEKSKMPLVKFDGLYNDDLINTFQETTGLYLSL